MQVAYPGKGRNIKLKGGEGKGRRRRQRMHVYIMTNESLEVANRVGSAAAAAAATSFATVVEGESLASATCNLSLPGLATASK